MNNAELSTPNILEPHISVSDRIKVIQEKLKASLSGNEEIYGTSFRDIFSDWHDFRDFRDFRDYWSDNWPEDGQV